MYEIVIVDYEAGNLRSVQKAFEFLGFSAVLTNDNNLIRDAKGIVLPGVGSFDHVITELRKNNLETTIEQSIALGRPYLGICLGYQILFKDSEEGNLPGLGIFEGKVVRFEFPKSAGLSIPHMGWNRLLIQHSISPIFKGIVDGSFMYFAHTYYPAPKDKDLISSLTDYGTNFASSITKDNVFGVQFHPEKSGRFGLKILKNFAELCLK
jgi:glutamine amidotransferase